jgi:hypothetical protein
MCSVLYVEGLKGPIVGKLPPKVLKIITDAVEPYECEPVRNNIAYINSRRAQILRAHLGALVLATKGIKKKLSSVIEGPPLKAGFQTGLPPTRR